MRYTISYGKSGLTLDVPQDRVVGVLAPRAVSAVPDIEAAVRGSLTKPFESAPLSALVSSKDSALIVTVDNTRPSTRVMLEAILDVCEAEGLRISVINATGRHRQMTEPEMRAHFGPRVMETCQVLQHDPFDEESMVLAGTTQRGTPIRVNRAVFEHDVVIGCGVIEPSYLCGWSGGRKLLMPGLAHYASIDNNHYYLTQRGADIGRLHGNPVSDDAFDFAQDLPLHFIVYAVCGPNDEFVEIVSGNPVEAHERACALCAPIYRVTPLHAGIVISSPGGWPYDFDLVQGKKAIIPASETVERNGVVILCAECTDGLGAEETFIEWLKHKTPCQVVQDVLDRDQFNLGAHGANILARPIVEKNAHVVLVTCPEVARALRGTFVTALTSLDEAWQLANLVAGRDAGVLFIEQARRLILDRHRRHRPARIWRSRRTGFTRSLRRPQSSPAAAEAGPESPR
jgi:nickel-dependent lactate racemase